MKPSHRARVAAIAAAATAVGVLALPSGALAQGTGGDLDDSGAALVPWQLVEDRDVDDRLPQPEDRYALAGGCYTIEAPGQGYVARDGDALTVSGDVAAAEPFHFQATRLGEYLIAANEGPDTSYDGAWWDVRSYVAGDTLASEPSTDTEWRIVAAGEDPDAKVDVERGDTQTYLLSLAEDGQALAIDGDALTLAASDQGTPFAFHYVADDDPTDDDPNGTACATWPEIDTNTSGEPTGNSRGPAGRVRGFFEAHVHGMAFEFLGGEAHCGRVWHPYGVEYALVDCPDHEPGGYGALLEVAVSGADPTAGHDTVGWPTFGYWPKYDSLTHEQFYYKWLERAYRGGLRLMTNLLVENTALCQIYPIKHNSCNEMDSVRLQARRIYELQDYIDAQSGGPGEGWLRIVQNPAQARATINAGRLAVVLGIEVSVIFDCGEILDVPQCTEADIDARLDEAFDMGVRQMELINKFDNALSGVTGDGGATGVLVNGGNKLITGHFWDMQDCPEEYLPHQHDKTQYNFVDDVPPDGPEEIDVLAGAIIDLFGPTRGAVAPAYGPAPHCNTRGLTDLGRYTIQQMIDRGMIFDPDHMSAAGQRASLDYIEQDLIPNERAAAQAAGRAPIQPALISSHSWANEDIYQRIYSLDGTVAPRTAAADRFVDRWAEHRAWANELAPPGHFFGMGYGADTSGFGGQPSPRGENSSPLVYDGSGWQAPLGDVTIYQQTSGLRTYDITSDGVAHYGLFADWFRELALAADEQYPELGGGDAIIDDMLDGAESYLRLWERAVYGGGECVDDQSAPQLEDLHAALGLNFEGFQESIGQPADREDAVYTYCVETADGSVVAMDVTFDSTGRATAVVPNAGTVEVQQPAPGTPDDGHAGHDHGTVDDTAGGTPLPTTGGGLVEGALLLLGLSTVVGSRMSSSRRRPSDEKGSSG